MPDQKNIAPTATDRSPDNASGDLVAELRSDEVGTRGPDLTGSTEIACDALVARLVACCTAPDPEDLTLEIADLRSHGLSARTIAETLVPRVARNLGDQWCEDNLGFAQVTIGCARLHGALRRLGPDWYGTTVKDAARLRILLLVPDGADHTLGGIVLAGKLRRLGYWVKSAIGHENKSVAETAADSAVDLVLVSASQSHSLEQIGDLVRMVRSASQSKVRIVIGGLILQEDSADRHRVLARTGADLVTNDLSEALRLCGTAGLESIGSARVAPGRAGRG